MKEKLDNWLFIKWVVGVLVYMNMKCFYYKDIKSSVGGFERLCNLYFFSLCNFVGCFKFFFGRYEDFLLDRYEF